MVQHISLWAAVSVLALAACASVPSPPPPPSPAASPIPDFSFVHDFGACASDASAAISLSAAPGQLNISGSVEVPDPCHKLTAWPEVSRDGIVLRIDTQRSAETCIQCLGAIPFAARVGSLEAGTYTVRVEVDGREIHREAVRVP